MVAISCRACLFLLRSHQWELSSAEMAWGWLSNGLTSLGTRRLLNWFCTGRGETAGCGVLLGERNLRFKKKVRVMVNMKICVCHMGCQENISQSIAVVSIHQRVNNLITPIVPSRWLKCGIFISIKYYLQENSARRQNYASSLLLNN